MALSRCPVRSEPISAFSVPDRAAPVARATLVGFVTTTQLPESLCTWENALTRRHIVLYIIDKYRAGAEQQTRESPGSRIVLAKGRSRVPRGRTQSQPWFLPSFPSLSPRLTTTAYRYHHELLILRDCLAICPTTRSLPSHPPFCPFITSQSPPSIIINAFCSTTARS